MKYQKTWRELERERAARRLKEGLLFVFGILGFLILLGLVGGIAG